MSDAHAPGSRVPVSSFDEWTRLREVIVGRADFYDGHDVDSSFRLFYFDNVRPPAEVRRVEVPPRILAELEEDIEELAGVLHDAGVTVHRPARPASRVEIVSPFWRSRETPPLNVRDQAIVLGNTIVETAPHQRARYFENDYLKPIFYEHFLAGSQWIAMPRPTLGRSSLDAAFFSNQETGIDYDDAMGVEGLGYEMIFDGAQCMRFGADVVVNVANRNHSLGLEWLSRQFDGAFRFWPLSDFADSHIDSLIVPLRPGLLMLRNPKVRSYLPPPLQRWDVVYPPDMSEDNFPDYSDFGFNLASKYIDTNVLSIDEKTVIANSLCPEVCRLLERQGFDVIPVRHRHRRLYNGGFHCFTLDTIRDGGRESYL